MSRFTALIALLAFTLMAAAPARAQYVPNGFLFVATDNPVTFTFLGASPEIPVSSGYGASLYYSTGPGVFDVEQTANVRSDASAPVGASASSPILGAGTFVFLAQHVPNDFLGDPTFGGLLTTGGSRSKDPFFTVFNGQRFPAPSPFGFYGPHAGVFYQPNNTALVGFTKFADGPLSSDFSSYAIRFSVSNVFSGIGAVPEPATWMLTLIGLTAAGLTWRRRMR